MYDFESSKKAGSVDNSNDRDDLIIEVKHSVPFTITDDISIEDEVKSCIKDFKDIILTYLFRILVIFIILVGVLYFQGILMFLSDSYYMTTNRIPLLDRVHQILEPYDHPFTPMVCNISMFVFIGLGIARVVLFTPLFYSSQMTLRYVSLFGTAYFLRGFFVYMTTMPSCYYNCSPDLTKRRFFSFLIRIIAGYMGIITNCTDLIISGHTMFTVITCILFVENVRFLVTKIFLVLCTAFILFAIIACKYHYTVDVLLGLVIAVLLHYYYYTKVDEIGVHTLNKIYYGNTRLFQEKRTTKIHNSFFAKFLSRMELVEEKLILGQKMRTLYFHVNSKEGIIDNKLRDKFNHLVNLVGCNESEDLLTLYRGTRHFNFYYWKYLYRLIFKSNKSVVTL